MTRLFLLVGAAVAATACASRTSSTMGFAPVTAPAPSGSSAVLLVDTTIAVAPMPPAPAMKGAMVGGCAALLRDPKTGVRYMIFEARRVASQKQLSKTELATVILEQANYSPFEAGDFHLPAGTYLRVSCADNHVLGLATTLAINPGR